MKRKTRDEKEKRRSAEWEELMRFGRSAGDARFEKW